MTLDEHEQSKAGMGSSKLSLVKIRIRRHAFDGHVGFRVAKAKDVGIRVAMTTANFSVRHLLLLKNKKKAGMGSSTFSLV